MKIRSFLFSLIPPAASGIYTLLSGRMSDNQALLFSVVFLILWAFIGRWARLDGKKFAKPYFICHWTVIISLILIVIQWIVKGAFLSPVWRTISTFCFRAAWPAANWLSSIFSQIFVSSNIWFIHVVALILMSFCFCMGFFYTITISKRK